MKKMIRSVLIAFVVISAVFLVYKEIATKEQNLKIETFQVQEKTENSVSETVATPKTEQKSVKTKEAGEKKAVKTKDNPPVEKKTKIFAYYFHGSRRCPTCHALEEYSRDAIEKYFSSELKEGKMEFKTINIEESGNEHYAQDYQLYTKSLILSLKENDKVKKWKNLEAIWDNVGNREKFEQYVKKEVDEFLKEMN